jgi:hypothetical protein
MADKLVEMADEAASPVVEAVADVSVADAAAELQDTVAAAEPAAEEAQDAADPEPAAEEEPAAAEEAPAAEPEAAAAPDAEPEPEPEEQPAAAAEAEPEPEHLSNEDVIASFLEANASEGQHADSSIAQQEAVAGLIVQGSAELPAAVETSATNGTSLPADAAAAEGDADGDGKGSPSGGSARIKRLSSMFEAAPEAGTSSSPPSGRVGIPIGKVKHSFGGASGTGAADKSQPLSSVLVSAPPSRARCCRSPARCTWLPPAAAVPPPPPPPPRRRRAACAQPPLPSPSGLPRGD